MCVCVHGCVLQITWTHLLEEALGLCSPKHRLVGEELFCRIYKDMVLNRVTTEFFAPCAHKLITDVRDGSSYC